MKRPGVIVQLKFNSPEFKQLCEAADRAGMLVTTWLRELVLATSELESVHVHMHKHADGTRHRHSHQHDIPHTPLQDRAKHVREVHTHASGVIAEPDFITEVIMPF